MDGSDCSANTGKPAAGFGNGVAAIETAPSVSRAPHLPQKFDAGRFSAPHLAQSVISGFPHCAQKLFPGGLLVPHFEQRIGLPDGVKRRFMYHLTPGEHYCRACGSMSEHLPELASPPARSDQHSSCKTKPSRPMISL
jgi:hypothetical protein